MKINFSFWKKESNCMKVWKYSDQTMWKWGGFFCIISSNIWYSLPEWISYFLLGLRFPTFSASVTQEFIRPRTIKICWTWSCFCFFFIRPLLYLFLKFMLYLNESYRSFPNFWNKAAVAPSFEKMQQCPSCHLQLFFRKILETFVHGHGFKEPRRHPN